MRRRLDIIDHWHCIHPCEHKPDEGTPKNRAWRYVVATGDCAYELTVSGKGGKTMLHRAFRVEVDDDRPFRRGVDFEKCDILRGGKCMCIDLADTQPVRMYHEPAISLPDDTGLGAMVQLPSIGTERDDALKFWETFATQGQAEQPESFWKALEARAAESFRVVRLRRYMTLCKACGGRGILRIKKPGGAK